MTIDTLARVYISSRKVLQHLGNPSSVDELQHRMKQVAATNELSYDLMNDLANLHASLNTMSMDELVVLVKG